MEDLSLHILDIAENSVRAGANFIKIIIKEDVERDIIVIEIEDNGHGMSSDELKRAMDPFFTTKKNKRVGLGLSLFSEAARMAGGSFEITSGENKGIKVLATFQYSHIDRKPLGNIRKTLETLIIGNPSINFLYRYTKGEKTILIDTRQIRSGDSSESSYTFDMIKKIRQFFNDEKE